MRTRNNQEEIIEQPELTDQQSSIEAIESIYTEDVIDLLEEFPSQLAANDSYYADVDSDSESEAEIAEPSAESEVYCLDSIRMQKNTRRQERRANKEQLSDRRETARLDENGEPQLDRRAQNRLAMLKSKL